MNHATRPIVISAALLMLAALACASPIEEQPPGDLSYRYDNLPGGDEQDAALSEFRTISRWGKLALTYFFVNGSDRMNGDSERSVVQQAFGLWAAQTPLNFTEVANPDAADILIAWAAGEHGDGDPFDGPGDVLAHASSPNPFQDRRVILHFDEAEPWIDSATRNVDLLTVAGHEIGHNLGLDHSRDQNALMFAAYSGPHRFLNQDDIAGVQSLYGIARQPAESPQAPPDGASAAPSGNQDTDGDGLSDADETLRTGTDPGQADTDRDGIDDGIEVEYQMNPLDPDMDKDGVSDGDEVAAGTDPFFPDQDPAVAPELGDQISEFLTQANELQIRALEAGDASIAAPAVAEEALAQLQADIAALNAEGLLQLSAIDYYESYISAIRVISEAHVEVDTCEVWSAIIYRRSDGAPVQADGPSLLPQTLTIQRLESGWRITKVAFFGAPAFCE
jgi:hypothetical protein